MIHMNFPTLEGKAQAVIRGNAAGISPLDKQQLETLVSLGDSAGEIVALIAAYNEAIEDIAFWAHYASEFYQLKHDVVGTLRKHHDRLNTLHTI